MIHRHIAVVVASCAVVQAADAQSFMGEWNQVVAGDLRSVNLSGGTNGSVVVASVDLQNAEIT